MKKIEIVVKNKCLINNIKKIKYLSLCLQYKNGIPNESTILKIWEDEVLKMNEMVQNSYFL